MGLVGITPLKDLFQAIHIPTVELSMDLHKIEELPIGTTNVMKPCDHRDWCRNHSHGKHSVWHDYCARVMVCKVTWWLRKTLKVQPTVEEVNAQRILW